MESSLELHSAVCINDTENLQGLLESGHLNINEKDTEWGYKTALHWAAHKGYVECAKQLLDFGANGTARMAYGATPAHCAAEAGRVLILKLFVKSKVSVTRSDDFGDKPIDKAKAFGHTQCVTFLKQAEMEAFEKRKARAELQRQQKLKKLAAATKKKNSNEQLDELPPPPPVQLLVQEEIYNSDPDIDDDPIPHSDDAYLAWMTEQQKTHKASSSDLSQKRQSVSVSAIATKQRLGQPAE